MSIVHRAQVVAVTLACLIPISLRADDAPESNAASSDEAADGLETKIEIIVNGGLRSDRVTEHGVSISLRNISDEEIAGPIGITINGTGIDELQLVLPEVDGDTKNYFEVVRDTAVLRPDQTSRPVRVEFRSMNALTFLDRNNFALDAKVVRPEDVESEDQVADAADAQMVPGKDYSWEEMYEAFENQNRWTPFLMEHDGVIGTGTAEDDAGNLVIRVYTRRHGVIKDLPANLGGMDLQQNVVGEFTARPAQGGNIRPGGGAAVSLETRTRLNHGLGRHMSIALPSPTTPSSGTPTGGSLTPMPAPSPNNPPPPPGTNYTPPVPTAPSLNSLPRYTPSFGPPGDPTIRFDRPVPIGVSTANMLGDCGSGTIGCRVIDSAGIVYGLSNNHVWALENAAIIGDPIVQPGLSDHVPSCEEDPLDIIGTLVDFEPLDLLDENVMDCSLMLTTPAMLQAETPDDGYGTPSSSPFESPFIGLPVQKYGRTSLLTRGRVIGLNVNATIAYTSGDVLFVSLIEFADDLGLIGGPGDSGSLVVTIDGNRPVSLLIGGGGGSALSNPIMPVLERFNVIIDDGSLTPAPTVFPISGRMGIATGPVVPTPVTIP